MKDHEVKNALKNFSKGFLIHHLLKYNSCKYNINKNDLCVSFSFKTNKINLRDSSNKIDKIDKQVINKLNSHLHFYQDKLEKIGIDFKNLYFEIDLNPLESESLSRLLNGILNFEKNINTLSEIDFIKTFNELN